MNKKTFMKLIVAMLLIHLDFNIGLGGASLDILPNFIGYILIFLALCDFEKLSSGFRKFKPVCIVLICYSAVTWVVPINIYLVHAIVYFINVAFWFMLLAGISALCRQSGLTARANTLAGIRNFYCIFQICFFITANLFYIEILAMILGVINLLMILLIAYNFNQIRQEIQ
ncbi:hypothetical protein [Anaerolentibacter hominis]|uniref:hypothetical protein n=1 Tax=Anaerolentibacter hominis TaxID=3079009 RepID=UPI0031B83FA2